MLFQRDTICPHQYNTAFSFLQAILKMFIDGKKNFAIVYNNKVIGSLGIDDYNEEDFVRMLREEFKEIKRNRNIKLNRIRKIYQKDINDYKKMVSTCVDILGN